MRMSRTGKRMARNNSRMTRVAKLNLVSLMDIFTILVFFLLFNSGDSEILQSNKEIELPQSVSEQQPVESLVVMVTENMILVEGREVSTMNEFLDGEFGGFTDELEYRASKRLALSEEENILGRPITIMANDDLEYDTLKQVMAVCANSGFRNISLAVSNVAREG